MDAHKKVSKSSYGALGAYSTKTRFPQVIPGPAAEYKPSPYQSVKAVEFRKAYVGRQLYASFTEKDFGKLEYVASPFSDSGTKKSNEARKIGFGRSGPMSRDDVSNIYDVLRYRQQLNQEIRTAARGAAMEEEKAAAAGGGLGDSTRSLGASTGGGAGTGLDHSLRARLPQCDTDFDRKNHVPEFTTKTPRDIKYSRDYGTYRSAATEIGEGCFDAQSLSPPKCSKGVPPTGEKTHLDSTGSMSRFV